jgi:TRAP-type C4-dicarboxylate transport system permease small subunit
MEDLAKVFDWILRSFAYCGGFLVVLMMLCLSYEVFIRYFFVRPTSWAIDFVTYMMFAATFLGTGWVMSQDAHTRIDVFTSHLNPKARAGAYCVTSFVCFLLCAILLWKSGQETLELYRTGETFFRSTVIPKFIVVGFLPLGAFLLCIQCIRDTWKHLNTFKNALAK